MIRVNIFIGTIYCAPMPAIGFLAGFGFARGLAVASLAWFAAVFCGIALGFMEDQRVNPNWTTSLFFVSHVIIFLTGAGVCAFGGGL